MKNTKINPPSPKTIKNILKLLIPIPRTFHERILSNLRFPYQLIRKILYTSTLEELYEKKLQISRQITQERKRKKKPKSVESKFTFANLYEASILSSYQPIKRCKFSSTCTSD